MNFVNDRFLHFLRLKRKFFRIHSAFFRSARIIFLPDVWFQVDWFLHHDGTPLFELMDYCEPSAASPESLRVAGFGDRGRFLQTATVSSHAIDAQGRFAACGSIYVERCRQLIIPNVMYLLVGDRGNRGCRVWDSQYIVNSSFSVFIFRQNVQFVE